ncbi:MAG: riboflavin synthase [Dermatophilaceae bacterium]
MFTGIVEELGTVLSIQTRADDAGLTIEGPLVVSDTTHGASIAVNGVCLTVVDYDARSFTVDVMAETLRRCSLGALRPGQRVNLERALAADGRFAGHIVQGHVDTTTTILARTPGQRWEVVRFALPASVAAYVVAKGSIAVDGVSLTVSGLGAEWFEVSLIPTTLAETTLGYRRIGDTVNIEADALAKYVERLLQGGVR